MPLTRRSQGVVVLANSTATTALAEPVPTTTKPTSCLECLDYPTAILRFIGRDAADETVNFQVILWTEYSTSTATIYVPRIVAKGTYVLSTTTVTVAGLDSTQTTAAFFADHIILERAEGGVEVVTSEANSKACLKVALSSAHLLTVGTDLGTAAGACVLGELSDELVHSGHVLAGDSAATLAVATAADQTIFEAAVPAEATILGFEVKNDHATKALDAFAIARKFGAGGDYETVASVAADYAVPEFPILTCSFSDDPVTLNANGSIVYVTMDVRGTSYVRVAGSAEAAGASSVSFWWRMS